MAELVQELVSRARNRAAGNSDAADAFAALIERFERAALAVAHALLHDPDRAGDAVQDGFLRAWQELAKLQDEKRFGGWLMQIVRNAAIDQRRRAQADHRRVPRSGFGRARPCRRHRRPRAQRPGEGGSRDSR